MLKMILDDYEIIKGIHLDKDVSKKTSVGGDYKACRFCGRSNLEVSFQDDAHALPEFIGNKYLVSAFECDVCNQFFGGTIETDMANFMQISHLTSGIQGKKGKIPEYKRSGVSAISDGSLLSVRNVDIRKTGERSLELDFKSPSFTPIGVYKCLTKMALTIMPEGEIKFCKRAIDWIREKDHNKSKYNFERLFAIYSFTADSFPFVSAVLLKRKRAENQEIPSFLFRLTYSNYLFQTYVPLSDLDSIENFSQGQFPCIPNLIDLRYGWNTTEKLCVDFNMKDKAIETVTLMVKDLS